MKKYLLTNLLFVFICSHAANIVGQSTVFTYQGSLQNGGIQANDSYDFEFALFDAETGGTQIGATVTMNGVPVIKGIFSVELNFGNQFPGANRFLEIRARRSFVGTTFTTLSPRQLIASTPYAIRSLSSENATQLGGTPAANFLQSVNRNNTLTGDGSGGNSLGVAIPLTLTGSVANQGIVHANNTNELGNALFGSINGTTFPCANCAAIRGVNNGYGNGIFGSNSSGGTDQAGVKGESAFGTGVIGVGGLYGVRGISTINEGIGVSGTSPNGIGVRGESAGASAPTGNAAVFGVNTSTGAAIQGLSVNGYAGYFSGKTFLSGNVGIGTGSPEEKLDVLGNSRFQGNVTITGTLNATIPGGSSNYIQNTTIQQGNSSFNISGDGIVGGTLAVGNAGNSGRIFLNRASAIGANSSDISFYSAGTPDFSMGTSQGSAGATDFSIYNYGTSSNALTLQRSTGFLGLGTTSPTERFHVVGNGIFSGGLTVGSNGNGLYVRPAFDGQSGPIDAIRIQGPNSPADGNSAQDIRWSFASAGSSAIRSFRGQIWDTYLQFITSPLNSNTPTVRMHISENGNVGIGTTSPAYKLHVNGDMFAINSTFASVTTGSLLLTNLSATGPGSSLCAIGPFPTIIGLCSSSSLRYKKNISDFDLGLDAIRKLRPIRFQWRSDGSSDFGLGAEDVEKINPELVFYKDGKLEGVRYERLPVVLINAVKEQQQQIELLKAEVDASKKQQLQIESLKAEIEMLKHLVCASKPAAAVCRKEESR